MTKLKIELADKILDLRAMQYLMQKQEFILWYEEIPENEKEKFRLSILNGEINLIKRTIAEWMYKNYGHASIHKLRLLASQLGIPYYASKTRIQLLTEIKHATNSA